MSVATCIASIEASRNSIRNKLVELGVAQSGDKLEKLATDIESIVNQGAVSVTVKEGDTYTIPKGYHNGSGTVSGVGGGDSGLPGGISKIATGTFTSTEDVSNAMVDHGLGEIPMFFAWAVVDELSSPKAGLNIQGAIVRKTHAINATASHKIGYFFRGYNANNSTAGAQNGGSSTIYMTDTQCRLCGNSNYQFLAGYEYRWVAGVIDGIE